MSRAWLPRRIVAGLCVLPAVLTFVVEPAAWAQDPNRDPFAVTVYGNDSNARRCGALFAAGNTSDEVVQLCTRALSYPRLTRQGALGLHTNLGITRLRRHEGDEALAEFDAVLALDPQNPEGQLNRGAALIMIHQPGPAVAAITQALSLGVAQPEKAYYNRGAAREALGDLRGAYEDYSTALQIRPQWAPADQELARFVRGRREHLATVLGVQAANP
jgi:tetratricopeptide (TPR) repeat protein